MKKTTRILAVLLLLVLCCTLFSGCAEDGASAYDIAVKNGFVGTEAEWLASLKGKDITIDYLYHAAQEEGYTGSLLDYLTDCLGVDSAGLLATLDKQQAGDLANRIPDALCASVSVQAVFGTAFNAGASRGSGVIYQLNKETGDAYIITNYHVVQHEGAISSNISVFLFGSEYTSSAIPCSFLGGSERYDIAVLKVKNSSLLQNSAATCVTVGDSNLVAVGNTAIAIGNASGAGISVTSGVVSVDSEIIQLDATSLSTVTQHRVMRIDAPVNEGNSGGGLFDKNGVLIGIVNAKTIDESIEGVAYAIPSNIAVAIAQNIIDNCQEDWNQKPVVATLGVTVIAKDSASYYDTASQCVRIRETVAVESVSLNSAAYRAGIRQGDILISYSVNEGESKSIDRTFTLVDAVLPLRVGDTLTIHLQRNGLTKTVTITLTQSLFSERG